MRMLRMDAYIGTAVLMSIGVVLLAFLGLMSLFAMLEELREDDAGYLVSEMFVYVALTIPRRIYEVLPYVVFLGALIGLGSLASRSEIVIFRTAGVSPGRIYLGVAWPAVLIFLFGFALGEWVAPKGEEQAEVYKSEAMSERAAKHATRGYWYREGLMNMRVSNIGQGGELLDVLQFWYDDRNRLLRTVAAGWAEYLPGDDPHWILHEVEETRIGELENTTRQLQTQRWDGQVDPRLLTVRVLVEPRKLSLEDLYRQIEYMQREGRFLEQDHAAVVRAWTGAARTGLHSGTAAGSGDGGAIIRRGVCRPRIQVHAGSVRTHEYGLRPARTGGGGAADSCLLGRWGLGARPSTLIWTSA